MSKYTQKILNLLSKEKIKSTNELLRILERKEDKTISWNLVYRILFELTVAGKIEKLEAKGGFFWRKK